MPEKISSRYSASFSAGSLLHKETTSLLPLLLSENAEYVIKEEIKNNQLLHINSESARKRIVSEIIKRIQFTNPNFWDFYAESFDDEQKVLLFYCCLKTYALIFDFHFNVTVKQWHTSSQSVEPYFYQMELEEIATRDEFVDSWTDTTKRKAISVYMRILRDLKLINARNILSPIQMSDSFWHFFVKDGESWFFDACLLDGDQKERIVNL